MDSYGRRVDRRSGTCDGLEAKQVARKTECCFSPTVAHMTAQYRWEIKNRFAVIVSRIEVLGLSVARGLSISSAFSLPLGHNTGGNGGKNGDNDRDQLVIRHVV